ncbi:MAG: restriction endonuclease subunit S, partial [Thermodesulfovibrionia bacterium]|nr:restriction endonuclease subunit S [Thermodesulfovibrionia bacterium]
MTFPSYPKYKDLGNEWLDEIPEHWDIQKLKYISFVKFSNVDKHKTEGEALVRLCNYVDVYYNDYITNNLELMGATASSTEIIKFTLKKGDTIITKDSESWDDIAVPAYVSSDLEGILCGYHLAQIRPKTEVLNGEFLFRSFCARGINDQFRIAATGVTRYGLGKYWLDNSIFPVPPKEEQSSIASFLDRETEKIDTLISKKERQIELLQEKRSALISHVVTKGLDPNVKMKDSGVEWIGEIPEGWEVRKLKYIASIKFSNVDKHTKEDEIPVYLCNYVDVYYNDLITNALGLMKATATKTEIDKFALKAGDIIITKDSESWEDIAIPAYVKSDLEGVLCGYHLAQIRPDNQIAYGKYIFRAFGSSVINDQFKVEATGVTRYGLGKYWLDNAFFLLPTTKEQKAIASFLDQETQKIDTLIEKIKLSIEKLR